jgi:hypothetical protein
LDGCSASLDAFTPARQKMRPGLLPSAYAALPLSFWVSACLPAASFLLRPFRVVPAQDDGGMQLPGRATIAVSRWRMSFPGRASASSRLLDSLSGKGLVFISLGLFPSHDDTRLRCAGMCALVAVSLFTYQPKRRAAACEEEESGGAYCFLLLSLLLLLVLKTDSFSPGTSTPLKPG